MRHWRLAMLMVCVSTAACRHAALAQPPATQPPANAPATTQTARPIPAGLEDRLHRIAQDWVAKSGAPGVTAACALDDQTVIAVAAGLSRKDPATPMQPADRMLSGSTGKTYCLAVMLRLVEEDKADLDAPISRWLGQEPWFDRLPNARAITLRMLLNHTSGVPEHVEMPEFTKAIADQPQRVWKPEELVAYSLDKPPACDPGHGWSYADTNYILVGMIIERITSRPFYDEAHDRILAPLGLMHTSPSNTPNQPGLISGYIGKGNPFPVPEEVAVNGVYSINPQFEWTGGGYVSTPADLARWARLLWSGQVLTPATMQQVFQGVKAKTGPNDEYGLGVQMWPTRHGRIYAHTGWFPGYITLMGYYPDRRLGVALQINTDIGSQIKTYRTLADDLAEACPPAP